MSSRTTDPSIARPRARVGTRARAQRRAVVRRRAVAAGLVLLVIGTAAVVMKRDPTILPREMPGTPSWAREHYGKPDAKRFKARHITEIEFLGRTMFVHEKAQRHFLRLEALFEARAPEYAAAVVAGELDDWSYENRSVRGEASKSNHAFGLAVDVNALTNVLGTSGDMPEEVVQQWLVEGGGWGGSWSRPDPMHFETHLTPDEIKERYKADGSPKPWYLEELVGG